MDDRPCGRALAWAAVRARKDSSRPRSPGFSTYASRPGGPTDSSVRRPSSASTSRALRSMTSPSRDPFQLFGPVLHDHDRVRRGSAALLGARRLEHQEAAVACDVVIEKRIARGGARDAEEILPGIEELLGYAGSPRGAWTNLHDQHLTALSDVEEFPAVGRPTRLHATRIRHRRAQTGRAGAVRLDVHLPHSRLV